MLSQKFLSLIEEVTRENISDLHLSSNAMPYIRNKIGEIVPVESYGIMTDEDVRSIAQTLLGHTFEETTADVSYAYNESRFRVNISRTISGLTIAFRTIPGYIPEPKDIDLPKSLLDITQVKKGLILIT